MNEKAGVFFISNGRNEVLMLVESPHDLWGPPGGRCKKGETALEAAIREAMEEARITVRSIREPKRYPVKLKTQIIDVSVFEGEIVEGEPRRGENVKALDWLNMEIIKELGRRHLLISDDLPAVLVDWLEKKGVKPAPD